MPLVSICLPNLNTRPFLVERMESILRQTFTDWELIIVDDYSTDGAWELFQEYAAVDSRIQLHRGPQQGLYPGWNAAIERARGEFIYIATSDDTMALDCIGRLAVALNNNPNCDIAHCNLKIIDAAGKQVPSPASEAYEIAPFVLSSSDLRNRSHIRLAPFDGLLHLLGRSVYFSVTQLLYRRSLFDSIGPFESTWGGMGDFNWHMRAALVSNTVHVSDTWAGWRIHPSQSTAKPMPKEQYAANIESMIDHAIESSESRLPDVVRKNVVSWRNYLNDKAGWWDNTGGRLQRIAFVGSSLIRGRLAAWHYLANHFGLNRTWHAEPVELISMWTRQCGIPVPLIEIQNDQSIGLSDAHLQR